jgi:DNA replication protein DnaC
VSTFTAQLDREASDTIRGYVYQVLLTIKRWLDLQPGEVLELERGEDIDLVSPLLSGEDRRLLEQVKNYQSPVTLRSAVSSIAYFIEHRQNNPTQNLRFLYTTTAPVGKERPLPSMLKKNPAIFVWEQLRQGSLKGISQNDALQGIRIILSNVVQPKKLSDKTWEVFLSFVKNARDDQLLDLVYSFEWNTKRPGVESVSSELQKLLIERQYPTDRLQAQQQYANLFVYVFKLLSQSGVKKLSVEERTRQLSIQTLSERDRELLNNVVIRVCALESRVGSLEQSFLQIPQAIASQVNEQLQRLIQQQGVDYALNLNPTSLDLSVPLLVEHLSCREETVNALISIFNSHTWTAIHGIAGSGKTHLAVLIVQAINTCRAWVRLRGLNREQACEELDAAFRELAALPPQSDRYQWYCQLCQCLGNGAMLVLDDLPELSGSDRLSEQLIQLTRACRLHGVRLLSTSPYQPPFSLQELLGDQILHSTETPPFKDDEAAEILQAYGAPSTILNTYVRFINTYAQQHPVLITAIARYLEQQDWQLTEEVESRLLTGEYRAALNNQMERRVLDSIEDDKARELLYRLSLPIGSFSINEVRALASVNPVLERPGERLHALVGIWVQHDTKERLLISPLVEKLGESNLLPETKKSCHLKLGELIVSKRQLSPQNVTDAIVHFVGAEEFDRAGLMLISALQELNSLDLVVDYGWLPILWVWASLPLPEQMDLGIRLLLRGLQIATRHKHDKDISYLIKDLDHLLEQASENEAASAVFATILTSSILGYNDPIHANRHLRTALQFLPHMQEIRIPGSSELAFPDGVSLEFAIWTNSRGIKTTDQLLDWISIVEQVTAEQRQWAFNHEVAELGCLIVSETVLLNESEKPKEQQNWSAVLAVYEDLAKRAHRLNLELLWACAILSQIIILGEHCKDISAALTLARTAIAVASNDPRVQFLIKQGVGRQCVYAKHNDEGLTWLSQALSENTKAYPTARMKVLLGMSHATGSRDPRLSVQFAQQAVKLAETTPVDKSDLVKALGELAIAKWLAADLAAAFEPWEQAGEYLFACKEDTGAWKDLFVAYSYMSKYLTSLAVTDAPPIITPGREPHPAPRRGDFFAYRQGIAAYYNRTDECVVLANLARFAESIGNNERAAFWALRGMDAARETNQRGVVALLSQNAIPHLLLDNYYAEVLDLAMDAGAFLAAGEQQLQSGQVPQGFELDVAAILGNKPGELWRKAELNAVLVGLLPIIFRICTVALQNPELAQTQAIEVAAICRQISATAVDQQLWITAADLLEQIHSQEASHDEIIRRSKTFNSENDAVLRAIGYLIATMQNDTPLEKAIQVHMGLAPFVYRHPSQLSAVYRQVILPFFTNYWKIKFESMPLLFHSTEFVSRSLNTAENLPEAERVQFILLTVAFSLNVRSSPEFAQWVMASAPGVVSFFSSL